MEFDCGFFVCFCSVLFCFVYGKTGVVCFGEEGHTDKVLCIHHPAPFEDDHSVVADVTPPLVGSVYSFPTAVTLCPSCHIVLLRKKLRCAEDVWNSALPFKSKALSQINLGLGWSSDGRAFA